MNKEKAPSFFDLWLKRATLIAFIVFLSSGTYCFLQMVSIAKRVETSVNTSIEEIKSFTRSATDISGHVDAMKSSLTRLEKKTYKVIGIDAAKELINKGIKWWDGDETPDVEDEKEKKGVGETK